MITRYSFQFILSASALLFSTAFVNAQNGSLTCTCEYVKDMAGLTVAGQLKGKSKDIVAPAGYNASSMKYEIYLQTNVGGIAQNTLVSTSPRRNPGQDHDFTGLTSGS